MICFIHTTKRYFACVWGDNMYSPLPEICDWQVFLVAQMYPVRLIGWTINSSECLVLVLVLGFACKDHICVTNDKPTWRFPFSILEYNLRIRDSLYNNLREINCWLTEQQTRVDQGKQQQLMREHIERRKKSCDENPPKHQSGTSKKTWAPRLTYFKITVYVHSNKV